MPSEELFALADQLRELKETKKYAEQELKEITEEIDRVDAALAERMISMETQNFTRNGTMFCLTNTTRASAAAGRKDELFAALRAAGFGDLVYETVDLAPENWTSYNVRKKRKKTNKGAERRWQERTSQSSRSSSSYGK